MKRAYLLILIAAILIFSAFAISFGWYYYAKQSVMKAVGFEQKSPEPSSVISEKSVTENEIPLKKAVLKIGEKAAYRKPSGAQIVAEVKNIGNYAGTADIYAGLIYNQEEVANNSMKISLIEPGQSLNATINITYFKQWTAFDVRQI